MLASAAAAGAAVALWTVSLSGTASFEECLLERMNGQPSGMRSAATRICSEKFPRPTNIRMDEDQWSWSQHNAGFMTVTFSEIVAERFALNEVLLKISKFICGVQKPEDFETYGPMRISGRTSTFDLGPNGVAGCVHLGYVNGVPKR